MKTEHKIETLAKSLAADGFIDLALGMALGVLLTLGALLVTGLIG